MEGHFGICSGAGGMIYGAANGCVTQLHNHLTRIIIINQGGLRYAEWSGPVSTDTSKVGDHR